MPRYFFDLQDHEFVIDDEGTELQDDRVAKMQAVVSAGEYLRDHPELAWDGHEIRVHVFDAEHQPLFLVAILGVSLKRPL